jgi:hypothetical protein
MNMHLADGGYYDNSGVAGLVQWLHNGLSDLADRKPIRLPKQILVIRINAFPAAKQGYVKEHRGTFFSILGTTSYDEYVPGSRARVFG